MATEILVIKREFLFRENAFHGFISAEDSDFLSLILDKSEYALRDEALEKNPEFKQIIPYVVLINPQAKKVFGYKRFKLMGGMHETRLHDKFSFGLGGHIDKVDFKKDFLFESMMRELQEEVKMKEYPAPKIVGFINDDNDNVGKVHFGLLAVAETTKDVEKMENDEVRDEKFYSVEEIEKMMHQGGSQMDSWTRLSWPFVKQYILSKSG